MQPQQYVRLRRPWYARMVGGNPFQWVLSFAFVFGLVLFVALGLAYGFGGNSLGPVTGLIWPVIFLLLWLAGITATAHADAEGLHWRYWRRYSYRWVELDAIELTSRKFGYGDRAAIIVTANGREHRVSPANECGRWRVRFGGELVALAAAHGVATRINDADPRWNGARDLT